jgi:uncharacterized protein (DUF169 family)
MDLKTQATRMQDLLRLKLPPVAISFQSAAPAGVQHIESSGPSGCSYWKLAAEGNTFYTEAGDHLNCTIGAYTHNIDLSPEKAKELESMLGEMVKLGYLRTEEVPHIPRRESTFEVAVYAPLADAPFDPDVVIVRGDARQTMLLAEATKAANVECDVLTMGRPTCAMIPAAMKSEHGVTSFGCIGNRVYTGLGNDEQYFTIPGRRVAAVVDQLQTIVRANQELETFHRERAAAAGSSR